ncbi:MAG: hypothetical protein C0508_24800 [Cyanobacteria bacterium PR.023]|nr:hypothetical protein [Cyanobacteria bacterium PR.023]
MTDSAKLTKVTSEAYQGYQEGYQSPYQHGEVIDVENIEIFESGSQFSESLPSLPNEATKLTNSLTIKEAARVLGISQNSVRAKLKSGALSGCKVKGPTGEQWRVELTKVTSDLTKPTKEVTKTIEPAQNVEVLRLLEIIEKQNHRLEAASGQIGYLQAQLENSQDTIRLLEDRSRKPWWRRLWDSFKA